MSENPVRVPAEARRRGLLFIWGAQLMSLALLFFLTYIVGPESSTDGNHTLAWTLGAIGLTSFFVSFFVKHKLLEQAAAKQRPDLGTTAYVLAFALCELPALLGFLAYVITGLSYARHSFIIAAVGIIVHFPPRGVFDPIEAQDAGASLNKTTL